MQNEELEAITTSIKSKLGDDAIGIIADDIGTLITKNTEIYNTLLSKDSEIAKLKDTNEKLVIANGNLLQQVPMSTASKEPKEEEKEAKPFNFRDVFDSKGKFKR